MRAGEEFFNFHNHDFVRVAVAIPAVRVADPAFNGEQTVALIAPGGRAQCRRSCCSRNWDFPPTPARTCHQRARARRMPRGAGTNRQGEPRARCRRRGRLALADRPSAFQLRRRRPSRTHPRRGAQNLSAQLPRVLRDAPVRARRRRRARRDRTVRPIRRFPSARVCCSPPRNSRCSRFMSRSARTCGCRFRPRPTRRWPAQPCCSISRPPTSRSARPTTARAGRQPVGAMPCGVSLCRRRRGRIDHRPRLGRPSADLRKRQPARRVPPLQPRSRNSSARRSTLSVCPRSGCVRAASRRPCAIITTSCASFARSDSRPKSRGAAGCCRSAGLRALPLRAVEPGRARRTMRRGLRDPGAGAGDAAARDGNQARRDRRVRRARLDPGAAGVRTGDGSARLSARQHPRPTRCRGLRPARARWSRRAA